MYAKDTKGEGDMSLFITKFVLKSEFTESIDFIDMARNSCEVSKQPLCWGQNDYEFMKISKSLVKI